MKTTMEEIILCEAYDALLSGHKRQVLAFDKNDPRGNFRKSAIICRYAFEYYLRWDPYTVRDYLTWEIIGKLKLNKFINYIPRPSAIDPKRELFYVAWQLYPSKIHITDEMIAVRTMEARMANDIGRFPDDFFSGRAGLRRLKACVTYMIENNAPIDSVFNIYRFFATSQGRQAVIDSKLLPVYKAYYPNIIEMIHDSLVPEQRDEFARSYYSFCLDISQDFSIGPFLFTTTDDGRQYA